MSLLVLIAGLALGAILIGGCMPEDDALSISVELFEFDVFLSSEELLANVWLLRVPLRISKRLRMFFIVSFMAEWKMLFIESDLCGIGYVDFVY